MKALFTNKDIGRWFDRFQYQAEEKLLKTLKYAGEFFVKEARNNGQYIDRTGNLRSSIGYVIVKDGDVVYESFKEANKGTDKRTGVEYAVKLASELAKTHNKGFVLIGVAGMDYAVFVEAMDSKDVITGATIKTEEFLRETLEKALEHGGRI